MFGVQYINDIKVINKVNSSIWNEFSSIYKCMNKLWTDFKITISRFEFSSKYV